MSIKAPLSCLFIILREVDLEMSPLVLRENLGVFVNILTADGKYPCQGFENLQILVQMELYEKRKNFF